jgi:hypothetical protein
MDDQSVQQEIRADLLDGEQAEALHAAEGSAALVVVRRHQSVRGKLIAKVSIPAHLRSLLDHDGASEASVTVVPKMSAGAGDQDFSTVD